MRGGPVVFREQNLLQITVVCEDMREQPAPEGWDIWWGVVFMRRDKRGKQREALCVTFATLNSGVAEAPTLFTHPYKSTHQLEQRQQAARLHGNAASPSSPFVQMLIGSPTQAATSRSQTCSVLQRGKL